MPQLYLSENLRTIADLIPPGSRVLDIGCSKGHLLAWLKEHKAVQGRGIEICKEKVQHAIAHGLSVVQGDAATDLLFYQQRSYDYIILNQILQQMHDPVAMLSQAAKIAEHIIISVPNFGHWRNRWYLFWHGKMPVTRQLNYEWYETPNIHFCTLKDFAEFIRLFHLQVDKKMVLTSPHLPKWLASQSWISNLFGEKGIFLLSVHQKN